MNSNCPFCNADNQLFSFASADNFKAIYNLSPILPGHCLVLPERHATSLFDLNEEEISSFFSFARKVTAFVCEVFECDAYDWSLQEGNEAGQSIDHLHLHIIPRKPDDLEDSGDWYGLLQKSVDPRNKERLILSETEYRDISLKLRELWK